MTKQPKRTLEPRHLAMLHVIVALLAGTASAQPPSLTVVPNNAGPVNIADLQVLLGYDLQFQMFDFESKDDFCLHIGYIHELDGTKVDSEALGSLCHRAGRHRLIVTMRQVEGGRGLSFGLHELGTGMGVTVASRPLQIGEEISGATGFHPEETLFFDRDVTLMRWSFGDQRPGRGPKHDVRIEVRVGENTGRVIGTGG